MRKKIEKFLESIHLFMGLLLGLSLGNIAIKNNTWIWFILLTISVVYGLWFAKYLMDKAHEENNR